MYNWPNLVVFVLVVLPDLKFKTLVPLQSPTAPTERGSSEAGKSGTIPSDVGPESSLKLFSESYEEAFRKSAKSGFFF